MKFPKGLWLSDRDREVFEHLSSLTQATHDLFHSVPEYWSIANREDLMPFAIYGRFLLADTRAILWRPVVIGRFVLARTKLGCIEETLLTEKQLEYLENHRPDLASKAKEVMRIEEQIRQLVTDKTGRRE